MTPTGVSRLFESLTRIEMLSEISLPSHVILTPVDVIDNHDRLMLHLSLTALRPSYCTLCCMNSSGSHVIVILELSVICGLSPIPETLENLFVPFRLPLFLSCISDKLSPSIANRLR